MNIAEKKLIAEFAVLYRQTRLAKGTVDLCLDTAVAFAAQGLWDEVKHFDKAYRLLRLQDDVEFQRECLAKIKAAA